MSLAATDIHVRPMEAEDLPHVLRIEQASYPFPWSEKLLKDCRRCGYCCLVEDIHGDVTGYAILTAAAGESHILNLCVDPSKRRLGAAKILLHALFREAVLRGAEKVFLEVRPSNTAALTLYQTNGFEEIGRRKDYYQDHDGREDAIVMMRLLSAEF